MLVAAFRGGALLSTPATTGRDLWLRTIPRGKELPVMSAELQQLIRSTAGQGRRELLAPAGEPGEQLGELVMLDGRLMYAGLVFGMPTGEPTWVKGMPDGPEDQVRRTILGPSRWRISARVPDGWDHVGLLMAPASSSSRTWHWPAEPGQTFETWADGREVWQAMERGWPVTVHEGITWREGKVLDQWAKHLVSAADQVDEWRAAGRVEPDVARLMRSAIRALLLHTIGGFAMSTHPVSRSCSIDRPELADPDGRAIDGVHVEGDLLVWQEPDPMPAWSADTAHPEYAATIWARARVRLLDGWNGCKLADDTREMVGALHVPRADVIAFATDGIYLSHDPGWRSSGAPGTFRVKGRLAGPLDYPRSWRELLAMRDAMTTE
jgi:hypothetical protein